MGTMPYGQEPAIVFFLMKFDPCPAGWCMALLWNQPTPIRIALGGFHRKITLPRLYILNVHLLSRRPWPRPAPWEWILPPDEGNYLHRRGMLYSQRSRSRTMTSRKSFRTTLSYVLFSGGRRRKLHWSTSSHGLGGAVPTEVGLHTSPATPFGRSPVPRTR